MSEPVKGKTTQCQRCYDSGYEAACRDIRRKMTQSHGAKLERAYFGKDAPPLVLPEVCEAEVSTR